ncbi:MAG: hypothetical protein ACOYOT_04020 [Bacteroidales bacterium]
MTLQSAANPQILQYKANQFLACVVVNRFLLWIETSRRFVLIEQPVFEVFEELSKGSSLLEIAILFESRYQLPIDECVPFVADVATRIDALLSETPPQISSILKLDSTLLPACTYISCYKFEKKILKLNCHNERLRHLFHPLFSHLEIPDNSQPDLTLSLFEWNDTLCLQSSNTLVTYWKRDDIPHFKGEVLGQIINLIYGKTDADWMMTTHASGLTDGNTAILFSAEAGAGKSTIAALLQARGFELLSDDFIAVDLDSNAYRFYMAMSVKSGAVSTLVESYPELTNVAPQLAANGKEVSFLPPNKPSSANSSYPIRAVVLVVYNENIECNFSQISAVEAVQRFLPEVYVTPNEVAVMRFMYFVQSTRFYTLQYSNNDTAISQIENLFKDEK